MVILSFFPNSKGWVFSINPVIVTFWPCFDKNLLYVSKYMFSNSAVSKLCCFASLHSYALSIFSLFLVQFESFILRTLYFLTTSLLDIPLCKSCSALDISFTEFFMYFSFYWFTIVTSSKCLNNSSVLILIHKSSGLILLTTLESFGKHSNF